MYSLQIQLIPLSALIQCVALLRNISVNIILKLHVISMDEKRRDEKFIQKKYAEHVTSESQLFLTTGVHYDRTLHQHIFP